jgi:flagellar protein FliO/FliZ
MVTDLKDIIEIIMGLLLCGFIIWLAYKFSRMISIRSVGSLKARYLHEVERIAMSTESYITLLQCGTGYYLVGVTKESINILAEINEETLQELPDASPVNTDDTKESEFFTKLKSELENIKNKRNVR